MVTVIVNVKRIILKCVEGIKQPFQISSSDEFPVNYSPVFEDVSASSQH